MAIIILLAFSVIAWVVLILPRQRELKRHQALMGQLEVGENVMMTSGIYGVIRSIDGDYLRLEIAEGLEITIAKRSVAARVEPPDVSADVSTAVTASSDVDSVTDGAVGQTPVGDPESEADLGEDDDDVVSDLGDEADTARGNEA